MSDQISKPTLQDVEAARREVPVSEAELMRYYRAAPGRELTRVAARPEDWAHMLESVLGAEHDFKLGEALRHAVLDAEGGDPWALRPTFLRARSDLAGADGLYISRDVDPDEAMPGSIHLADDLKPAARAEIYFQKWFQAVEELLCPGVKIGPRPWRRGGEVCRLPAGPARAAETAPRRALPRSRNAHPETELGRRHGT